MMADDILKSDFKPGECAFVLAPGPNGRDHWHKIPCDAFVIAVNQAIEIKAVKKTIWLASDGTLPEKGWFHKAAQELIASDYPLEDLNNPTLVFDSGKLLESYPKVRWAFEHGGTLSKPPWGCFDGVLRGGATVSAQAIQLAYHLGCRQIYLCGVDLTGRDYFNGGRIDNRQIPEGAVDENWLAGKWIEILIRWLEDNECAVYSLSETALNIKVIENYAHTTRIDPGIE